ncbi:sigma-54-dependent Fis family transcriptional regulator [Corallococcus sp. M34]|uniref:sigma-54-dependent Fis family transcriptional regulator n=1 Tax=Citreicoccus inhibens TaxID=2849499 RepID=UPI001C2255DB|nr:sigma-54-dependent Fis family transcriptional regulator [Citreicoccus inhibens]MBU8898495.1 sigma-54-dependent Fis family transcriptional regulator [Citreicoccus inhibens]
MSAASLVDQVREALRAFVELESLARAEVVDRDRLRTWALEHFGALVRIEQEASRLAAAPPARPPPAPESSRSPVLRSLERVSAAPLGTSLEVALGALMELTGAKRGFVGLRGQGGALRFAAHQGFTEPHPHGPEGQLSRTILAAALETGGALLLEDARDDARFAQAPSVMALALRAVLVVPLAGRAGPFGVLYLDHPSTAGAFGPEAREHAEAFARALGPLLERDVALTRAREKRRERGARLRTGRKLDALVGESDAMLALLELLVKVAPTSSPVLILGETGTGKELVAKALHEHSRRASSPFVAINCGALSPGLVESELFGHERGAFTGAERTRPGSFEAADGGTFFLDEVGELPLPVQAKLLRLLEGGTFMRVGSAEPRRADVRIVAATHKDLPAEVRAGRFREDLLFRLDVVRLEVPPLREREEDIGLVAETLIARLVAEQGLPARRLHPATLAALESWSWPGNVRELRNVLERAVVLSDSERVGLDALPREIAGALRPATPPRGIKEAVRVYRQRLVQQTLDASGSHAEAARRLGVNPKYLYKLIKDIESEAADAED